MKKTILILFTLMAVMASAQTHQWKIQEYTITNDFGTVDKELYGNLEVYKTGIAVDLFWITNVIKADTVFASYRGDSFRYSDSYTTVITNFQHEGTTYPSVTVQQIWDSCSGDGEINLAPVLSWVKRRANDDPDFWKH